MKTILKFPLLLLTLLLLSLPRLEAQTTNNPGVLPVPGGGTNAPSTNAPPIFNPATVPAASPGVLTGTNNPNGIYWAGYGSIYNQFDVTGTNFINQWIMYGKSNTNWLSLPSPAVVMTNWIPGSYYTNSFAYPISVHSLAALTTVAVTGQGEMDLNAGTNVSSLSLVDSLTYGTSTILPAGAKGSQGGLNFTVPPGWVFCFTNKSAGSGNSSSLVSGSGQYTLLINN